MESTPKDEVCIDVPLVAKGGTRGGQQGEVADTLSRRQLHALGVEGDDFSLHNLRDVAVGSVGKGGAPLRVLDLDLQSTASSSTVVHNAGMPKEVPAYAGGNMETLEGAIEEAMQRKHAGEPPLATKDAYSERALTGTTLGEGVEGEEEDQNEDDSVLGDVLEAFDVAPTSPPRELNPDKLYALFDFEGPDPSHMHLCKDDSVTLLNDSDSYWWLVRSEDARVGFAPAEILETHGERLARLNCWRNEVAERGPVDLSTEQLRLFKGEVEGLEDHGDSVVLTVPSATLMNESLVSIERKGSLKRPGDVQEKKAVSFADVGEIVDDWQPPKRISASNFLVKNVEDYCSDEEVGLAVAPHMALDVPKTRAKASDSMRLLEDLLSSFDDVHINTTDLHPEVDRMFGPLLAQVQQLGEMVEMMEGGTGENLN